MPIVRKTLQSDYEKHRWWLVVNCVALRVRRAAHALPGPERDRVLFRLPPRRPLPLDARRAAGPRSRRVAHAAERAAGAAAARWSTPTATSGAPRGRGRLPPSCSWNICRGSSTGSPVRPRDIVSRANLVKLRDLAERLHCRLEGDGDLDITRVAGLEQAGPGDLTFLANPQLRAAARQTRASAIILANDAAPAPCAMLRAAHPYRVVCRRAARCSAATSGRPPACIPAPSSRPTRASAPTSSIGPLVVVGARRRDRRSRRPPPARRRSVPARRSAPTAILHARVSVRERSVARRARRRAGRRGDRQRRLRLRHRQRRASITRSRSRAIVVIEDDVEIGANTTIDRPAVGETRIGRGTKIDNLVQIAHGVQIGEDTMLAAQVGIAGSSKMGSGVVLAGQVGVAGHLEIGDKAHARRRRRASPIRSRPARSSRAIPPSTTATG